MLQNEYIPFLSEIKEVIRHTDTEYTFRMAWEGSVRPGQFFEVSIPKYGEAPISVSGIGDGLIDLTIRRVGKVTNEIFERYAGSALFLRGPYGNGFQVENYEGRELVVIAGGTGLSPVRGVVDYFAENPAKVTGMTLVAGFKSPEDILFRTDFERWEEKMNVILTVDRDEKNTGVRVGLVTEYIPNLPVQDKSQTAAIVVGPPVMMRYAVQGLLQAGYKDENIWISHERKMCCGIGKCGHCKVNDSYICLDGPVYHYPRGRMLID